MLQDFIFDSIYWRINLWTILIAVYLGKDC